MDNYLLFIIKIYIIYLNIFLKVYSKKINIKNNDWKNIYSLINKNQNDNELILNFVDKKYLFLFENLDGLIDINVNTNIKFIGNEEGTVFDFAYNMHSFNFFFKERNNIKYTISFENIIFRNYKYPTIELRLGIILFHSTSNNFKFIFENCEFRNNFNSVLLFDVYYQNTLKNDDYSVIIKDCIFAYNIFIYIFFIIIKFIFFLFFNN